MYFKYSLGHPIGHHYMHIDSNNSNQQPYLQVWDPVTTLQVMINFAHICYIALCNFDIS